ncbi:MAG: DUF1540 domain-containing protein [Eubacteriales bacterium]
MTNQPDFDKKNSADRPHVHIDGIVCDVKNCMYHASHDCCTARQIKVGHQHADNSDDTSCVTFEPKDSYEG